MSVKWLTTLDLDNFVKKFGDEKTKNAFLGVFPIDHLPRQISFLPVLLIINTNAGNLPGQHWKAVYISKNRIGEVFDSLATPISLTLEHWLNEFTKKWTLSKLTIQNPMSPSCGGYVLYYVLTRLHAKSLKTCLSIFSNDVIANDEVMKILFKNFL